MVPCYTNVGMKANSETKTGTGKLGRENEIGYAGYRNRYNSIGSMSITVGNRYSKAGITNHATTSNVQLDTTVATVHNTLANSIIIER